MFEWLYNLNVNIIDILNTDNKIGITCQELDDLPIQTKAM